MATEDIPKEANELAAYMKRIIEGDDKHKHERAPQGDSRALRPETRTALEETRKRLLVSDRRVKDLEGSLAKARQLLCEDKGAATEATRRAKHGVYGTWGRDSMVVTDYGLTPQLHRGRPRGS